MTLEEKVDALYRAILEGKNDRAAQASLRTDSAMTVIRDILLELGAPDHLLGHPMMVRAILLVLENPMYINAITYGLYPAVAAEFDTTPSRVERAIRHLIEVTFTRCDYDTILKYFGNTICADKGKPTNGEFIARLANVVRGRMTP